MDSAQKQIKNTKNCAAKDFKSTVQIIRTTIVAKPDSDKAHGIISVHIVVVTPSVSKTAKTISFQTDIYRFLLVLYPTKYIKEARGKKRSMGSCSQVESTLASISAALWIFVIVYVLKIMAQCAKGCKAFLDAEDLSSIFASYGLVNKQTGMTDSVDHM